MGVRDNPKVVSKVFGIYFFSENLCDNNGFDISSGLFR